MTQPNRKDVRTALFDLLEPLESGDNVEIVVNGDPGQLLNGESPAIFLQSGSSFDEPMERDSAQNNTVFKIEVSTWVAEESPSADDLLDTIDFNIRTIVAVNRVTEDWAMILLDEPPPIAKVNLSGNIYWLELKNYQIQAF